jgi:hypothetical protein
VADSVPAAVFECVAVEVGGAMGAECVAEYCADGSVDIGRAGAGAAAVVFAGGIVFKEGGRSFCADVAGAVSDEGRRAQPWLSLGVLNNSGERAGEQRLPQRTRSHKEGDKFHSFGDPDYLRICHGGLCYI